MKPLYCRIKFWHTWYTIPQLQKIKIYYLQKLFVFRNFIHFIALAAKNIRAKRNEDVALAALQQLESAVLAR